MLAHATFWEGETEEGALQLLHAVIAMGYLSENLHDLKDANLSPFTTVADLSELLNGQRTLFL